jgi:RHS repeat-associated protein
VLYAVDGDGLRRSRDTGTGKKDFTWDVGASIPLLLDDGQYRYIYGPSWTPIEQVNDETHTTEYLYGDAIGSTRVVTDDAGAVVGSVAFDEYGNPLTGSAVESRFGFAGSWTDPDSGLLYLRSRDYDPGTGQFMQVDPAVSSTGQPYAYAGNNPMQNVDPLGLDWWSDAFNNVAAFGAGALNELTGGLSSAILAIAVPGYDCFIQDHRDAYDAGAVVAVIAEVVVAVATVVVTLGAAAPAVIGAAVAKFALKQGVKAGVKAVVHGLEKTAAHAAEKSLVKDAAKECNSFTADTPVLMADGTKKPIQDVAVGDKVKATDPDTGQSAAEPVAGLIRHSGDHAMADVALADGTTIHATAGHPFWDATIHAFINAGDLTVGDQVLTADGALLSVTGVYLHQQDLTAYNLSITDIHTYYAGDAGVLVHNTGPECSLNLASDARTQHILYGDATGGGHLPPGKPDKTLFPTSWSADDVMTAISEVATNPGSKVVAEQGMRTVLHGRVNGILIKVVTDWRDIITGYPLY